ncbi:MAG: hypothetical protein PQJ60_05215 [Spirochaetales bacterium]|nr:hypothetical protein [Spirochaetales bacterium]
MEKPGDEPFIRNVETMIDPEEYAYLYVIQKFKRFLPRKVFKKLLQRTSRKTPVIGFVIEPYSLFLFFKLRDVNRARDMLPERYELVKASIFDGEEPDYYMGYGTLNTRASTFWGVRLESYLIARDRETGLLSWIFIDILSSTLIALPREGVGDGNSKNALFTTNSQGDIFADIGDDLSGRRFSLKGNLRRGQERKLDEELWLMGNTSIAHSRKMMDRKDDPFAVIFDPAEVERAWDIPPEDLELRVNNLFPGLAEPTIAKVLCFPFAQHYIADSPGCRTFVKDREDMLRKYKALAEGEAPPTFSTGGIRKLFLLGTGLFFVLFVLALLF